MPIELHKMIVTKDINVLNQELSKGWKIASVSPTTVPQRNGCNQCGSLCFVLKRNTTIDDARTVSEQMEE